jgi:hypothetical protein
MSWDQLRAARQVLAEVKVGRHIRADQRREDAQFEQNVELIRKMNGGG